MIGLEIKKLIEQNKTEELVDYTLTEIEGRNGINSVKFTLILCGRYRQTVEGVIKTSDDLNDFVNFLKNKLKDE